MASRKKIIVLLEPSIICLSIIVRSKTNLSAPPNPGQVTFRSLDGRRHKHRPYQSKTESFTLLFISSNAQTKEVWTLDIYINKLGSSYQENKHDFIHRLICVR
ncbi:hypothetical protein Cni_G10926 [Canna indica]|uniref:Uncharacterized protein n=1 Tax=Canna indica TaxID=4628 RepID=A0AAQ3K937_9LILI|nr:hypothetical protein Cni_G10926 [Canna indica]